MYISLSSGGPARRSLNVHTKRFLKNAFDLSVWPSPKTHL